MMVEARPVLLASALALGLLGCDAAVNARALDRICATDLSGKQACQPEGVFELGGPTGDTVGIYLEDGSFVIHLDAVPEAHTPASFDIQVLAAARYPDTVLDVEVSWGSCTEGCPASPKLTITTLPTEPAWTEVAAGVRGAEPGTVIPYDARLTFTALQTDLIDLRFVQTP